MPWELFNPYRYRDNILLEMGFKNYRAYLQSSLWQSIRARVLPAECIRCNRIATQVHHRFYDKPTLTGACINALTPVCGRHHRRAERPGKAQDPLDKLLRANASLVRGGKEHLTGRRKRMPKTRRLGPAMPTGEAIRGLQKRKKKRYRGKPCVSTDMTPRLVK